MHHTGALIRQTRKTQKLSLRDLARLSEVDHSTLSRIENGLIDPSPRTVKAITDALGRNLAAHMDGAA